MIDKLTTKEKLDAYSERITETGCQIWMRFVTKKGYGRVNNGANKDLATHRASYELAYGKIPKGMHVLHRCDTPSCINPDHLFLGTNADNVRDRNQKQRQARGERNGPAVLTEKQVLEIRERTANGESTRALGREYGVGKSTIGSIHRKETWRHLDG